MSPITTAIVPLSEVPLTQDRCDAETQPFESRPVVLVVDDEPLVADTLTAILTREGFSVMKAYDATSALAQAAQRAPDLMLSDVAMPGMNGVDLASTMQDLVPTCKVLLFSGHNASGQIIAGCGKRFLLLTKPLHPTKLLQFISHELGLPERTPHLVSNTLSLNQAKSA